MKKIMMLMLAALLCGTTKAQTNSNQFALQKGYRGFVDVGIGAGGTNKVLQDFYSLTISTTQGYQVFEHLFVGLGVGAHLFSDATDTLQLDEETLKKSLEKGKYYSFPIFADVRYDILNRPVSPFTDVQFGGTVGDFKGLHLAASAGCRAKCLSISMGYSLQTYTYKNDALNMNEKRAIQSFMICRLTYEWGARRK